MKSKAIVICLIIIFLGCSKYDKNTTIDYIDVYFYNYSFEAPIKVEPSHILNTYARQNYTKKQIDNNKIENDNNTLSLSETLVLKTILNDSTVLSKIENEINSLQKDTDNNYSLDARIVCYIHYKNKKKLQLDIGDYLAESIFLNGELQQQNNNLLFLIKSSIGYYENMDGESYLKYQDELNDSSVIRDKIKDNLGNYY